MKPSLILSTILISISFSSYSQTPSTFEYIEPPPTSLSQKEKTSEIILNSDFIQIDYPRLTRMQNLLMTKSSFVSSYQEYKQLCNLATTQPKLGMTLIQARNTTWCFPYSRNKINNQFGELIQEVYLKKNYKGETNSQNPERNYLYFLNGILVTIQE